MFLRYLAQIGKIAATAVLLNTTVAYAADGEWDLSLWNYNQSVASGSAITTTNIASQGDPHVDLQLVQTVSGSISAQTIAGNATSGLTSIVQVETGVTESAQKTVWDFNYTPAVSTFGPAASQGNAFAGANGFGMRIIPISSLKSGTITVSLSGGAVFDAVGGTAFSRFQQTAGGVGSSSVTYTWNPSAAPVGSSLSLNSLVINGPVGKITVTKDFIENITAAGTSRPETVIFATRLDPTALPQPSVSAQTDSASGTAGTPITPVNVLANDTTDSGPSTLTNSVLTVLTPASNAGIVLDTDTGLVSTTAAVPAGTYALTYQICNSSSLTVCSQATVTVTLTGLGTPQNPQASTPVPVDSPWILVLLGIAMVGVFARFQFKA